MLAHNFATSVCRILGVSHQPAVVTLARRIEVIGCRDQYQTRSFQSHISAVRSGPVIDRTVTQGRSPPRPPGKRPLGGGPECTNPRATLSELTLNVNRVYV